MAKKSKAWVTGLIAIAIIAVIGVVGYYGANGELFQGKLQFNFNQQRNERVDRIKNNKNSRDAVVVDGVSEQLIMNIADRTTDERLNLQLSDQIDVQPDNQYVLEGGVEAIEGSENIALNIEEAIDVGGEAVLVPEMEAVSYADFSFETMLSEVSDLLEGDVDIELIMVSIDNEYDKELSIQQLRFLIDGGGVEDFEVFVGQTEIPANVSVYEGYVPALNQTLTTVEFNFVNPYTIPANGLRNFTVRADVSIDSRESFVATVLDAITTDQGTEFDRTYDFSAFTRNIAQ